MGRPDGKLVKDIPYFDRLIPHIMERRYDATNFIKIEFDLTNLHAFLRDFRAEGCKIGLMDAVIAAFARLLQTYPELNRFVVNKRIYQRNHICMSFVVIRRGENDQVQETAVKVYIEPGDDLVSISGKIRAVIKANEQSQSRNAVDNLVERIMSLPLLPGLVIKTLMWMDKYGLLPRWIVDLSPFHTSMFISNLASIHLNYVYHHLYDFGTTGVFITMGMPGRVSGRGGETRRTMALGVSIDERLCPGAMWARAFFEFKKMLENPGLLYQKPENDERSIDDKQYAVM